MKSNNFNEIVIGKPHLMVLRAMADTDWEVSTQSDTLRCNVGFATSSSQFGTWKDWSFLVRVDSARYGPRVVTLSDGLSIKRNSAVHICLKSGTDTLLRERIELNKNLTQT